MSIIRIYTDGACSGNPGIGGFGAVIIQDGLENKISGGHEYTTNNRMELSAVLEALTFVEENLSHVRDRIELYSDSKYVVTSIKEGTLKKWRDNRWMRANGEEVKNQDLWEQIYNLMKSFRKISFIWVKGHSGDHYNEIADSLATEEVNLRRMSLYE